MWQLRKIPAVLLLALPAAGPLYAYDGAVPARDGAPLDVALLPAEAAAAGPEASPIFAPPATPETLTLTRFVRDVIQRAPSLEAMRKRVETALSGHAAHRRWPDPVLTLGLANDGTRWSVGEMEMSQLMLTLRQDLPSRGMRKAWQGMTHAESAMRDKELAMARLDLAMMARMVYAEWQARSALVPVIAEQRAWMDAMSAFEAARFQEGAGSAAAYLKARTEAARMADMERMARRNVEAVEARMNALLDQAPATPLGAPDLAEAAPALPPAGLRPAESHPSIAMKDTARYMLDAEIAMAEANKRPMWMVEAGYGWRDELDPMISLMGGMTLPFRSRQAAGEEQARLRGEQAALDLERRAAWRELEGEAGAASANLRDALEALAALDTDILPQARAVLRTRIAAWSEQLPGAMNRSMPVDSMALLDDIRLNLQLEQQRVETVWMARMAAARLDYTRNLILPLDPAWTLTTPPEAPPEAAAGPSPAVETPPPAASGEPEKNSAPLGDLP